jgi:hypothetical protein
MFIFLSNHVIESRIHAQLHHCEMSTNQETYPQIPSVPPIASELSHSRQGLFSPNKIAAAMTPKTIMAGEATSRNVLVPPPTRADKYN